MKIFECVLSKADEKKMSFMRYYGLPYVKLLTAMVATTVTLINSYLFKSIIKAKLPLNLCYPFSTSSLIIQTILYIHHLFSLMGPIYIVYLDITILMPLILGIIELQGLKKELRLSKDYVALACCVRKHQKIIL